MLHDVYIVIYNQYRISDILCVTHNISDMVSNVYNLMKKRPSTMYNILHWTLHNMCSI